MAQAVTLKQLETGLRRRLAATDGGLFGDVHYPNLDPDETTNEIWDALNEAQNAVARDIYDSETYPFVRLQHEITVLDGTDNYTLPYDFIAEDQVRHVRGSFSQELTKSLIKDIRSGYDDIYKGSRYLYYDVRGFDSIYISRGIATSSHLTRLMDENGDFSSVRVGDTLYNITDGSEGEVTGFSSGYVTTELMGGRVNEFRVGDTYGIATAEQNRWVLQVWPKISAGQRQIYKGALSPIELTAGDIVDRVRVRFEELPDDYESDERVHFQFFDVANDEPTDELVDDAASGIQNVKIGWNEIPFRQFQARQDETFALVANREDGRAIASVEAELFAPSTDRLLLDYARCPRVMRAPNSIFEFPTEFVTTVYARAKIILLEKIQDDNSSGSQRYYQEYDYELEKTKENLWNRGQSGGFTLELDSGGDYIDTVAPGNNHWTPYHWG